MNDRFVVRTQPYRIENQMVFHNFQEAKDFYYQIDKKGKGVQLLYQFITPQGQYEEHLWKDNRNPLEGSFTFDAENFGGDPEGKLAKALERARKKAKQPRKPLKIERLKAESPQVGDEGLLWSRYNNRRVRIVGIEDNSGKTNAIGNPLGDVYFYRDLLDSGEADWRIHTDSEREFLSRFKPDKRAESFGADYHYDGDRRSGFSIVKGGFKYGKDRIGGTTLATITKGNALQAQYWKGDEARARRDANRTMWEVHLKENNVRRSFSKRQDAIDFVFSTLGISKEDMEAESFGAEAPSYMADSDAHKLMEASWRINSFVESTEEYPQWWKSRLSVAASNVDDLADYLDYAMSDDYDAESFNAEDKKMVAFRYSDKSPAHICEGQGYTNTTRCGKPVNWDKVKNPFNLTAQKIDETLGSVDKKGMILHGSSQGKKICMKCFKKAESYGAETRSIEKRKIGEIVAWNNSIIGMGGKWREGKYDLYEIGNQIGYVVVHQDLDNFEYELLENGVLLGSKGTDVAEISFAGLNIYTGSDGSFPIVGLYEDIKDYYARTQNKPHPRKGMSLLDSFEDYEKGKYLEDKWENEFTEWAKTVYDFKPEYYEDGTEIPLSYYVAKDLLQKDHKLLVGARISISNPTKAHLEQTDSKSSVWVLEYPNLTNLTQGQYRQIRRGTNEVFINTEKTVDKFFANLQKQYPDGRITENNRGWRPSKSFSIMIPDFGEYKWTATQHKLVYDSLSDEEKKRKERLEREKRQKEYAQQQKEKQDALKAKYGAETRSLAKRSWDALNNVETAVGTVGLAHMIGLGAIFGGSLAFLKGRKSNSKTEK